MLSTVSLVDEFREMRKHTLDLVETLEYDDFVVQTAPYVSPPKWHLGHVSWLFEMLLKQADEKYEYYSEEFLRYLNSYYNRFGEQMDKASRGTVSRPTVKQILEYYEIITKRITDLIQRNTLSEEDRKRFEAWN
ncbi:DinB family protein [Candidatus Nitrosotenuis chungbukensis]|uniref:DinB family protein n=1 Tax=Candidatus Nitrosotenuis chungbukensis TaxID=1353246 RepID=UPI002A4E1838|nr:DinB family protein [Candidatus Nitrosotenuis chungbukensis]